MVNLRSFRLDIPLAQLHRPDPLSRESHPLSVLFVFVHLRSSSSPRTTVFFVRRNFVNLWFLWEIVSVRRVDRVAHKRCMIETDPGSRTSVNNFQKVL